MKDAQPQIYGPLRNAEQLVVDALNIGRMCMSRKPDAEIQASILEFAGKYGLFGKTSPEKRAVCKAKAFSILADQLREDGLLNF